VTSSRCRGLRQAQQYDGIKPAVLATMNEIAPSNGIAAVGANPVAAELPRQNQGGWTHGSNRIGGQR